MKKVSLLFVLMLAVFAGCKKEVEEVEEVFSFDITNTKAFSVDKDSVNMLYTVQNFINYPMPVSGVSSSSEADFQKNGTSTNLVKKIVLKELILTMPDNSPESFSFLEKMDVEIAMEDGSEPILMAFNRNIDLNVGRRLVFTPTESSMDKYVKSGKYMLKLVNTRMRRPVTSDLNITASLTFGVTASPL